MMGLVNLALAIAQATGLDRVIGRLFGGNNGEQVAMAITDTAMTVTGAKSPAEALAAIEQDKALQKQAKDALAIRITELEQLAFEDRQHARAQQIATIEKSDSWLAVNFIYLFAGFWSLTAALYFFAITFGTVGESATRFADTVLGFLLGTVIAGVLNYFYGGSPSRLKPKTPKGNEK